MEQGTYKGNYVGKEMLGFLKNHSYEFELTNNGRTYELYAFTNITENKSVDLHIHYASSNSINRNWKVEE